MQKKRFAILLSTLMTTGLCLDASAGSLQLGARAGLEAQDNLPVQVTAIGTHRIAATGLHHTRAAIRTSRRIARATGHYAVRRAHAGVRAGGHIAHHPTRAQHASYAGIQAGAGARVQTSGYGPSGAAGNGAGSAGGQAGTSARVQGGARVSATAPARAAVPSVANEAIGEAGTAVNGVTSAVNGGVSASAGIHLGGLLQ